MKFGLFGRSLEGLNAALEGITGDSDSKRRALCDEIAERIEGLWELSVGDLKANQSSDGRRGRPDNERCGIYEGDAFRIMSSLAQRYEYVARTVHSNEEMIKRFTKLANQAMKYTIDPIATQRESMIESLQRDGWLDEK